MATSSAVMERQESQTVVSMSLMEQVVVSGDLAKLSAHDRLSYYRRVCESLGLNPFTKPFQYIVLNGRMTLYATRDCADQLRSNRGISVEKLEREVTEGIYVVTAYGRDRNARTDSATGAVPIEGLKGEARANAMMKAETKAKRRLTLSLAGLGWLDEVEVDTVPSAERVTVDTDTGEIQQAQPSLRDAVAARREAIQAPAEYIEATDVPPPSDGNAAQPEAEPSPSPAAAACGEEPPPGPLGMDAPCRLAFGHAGAHKSGQGSWPRNQ